MADWRPIGLGLGGNIGDPAANIAAAVDLLRARPDLRIEALSTLYRTVPWGPVAQPDFANACALGATVLAPRALLAEIKTIEVAIGRSEGERWGPRLIDIDILFYEGVDLKTPELAIPHRGLFERAFVLVPLAEIAPDLVIGGRRVGEAAAAIDRRGVAPWQPQI